MIVLKVLLIIVVCAVSVFGIAYAFTRIFPVIQVVGESMYPTYKDGEYLLSFSMFRKKNLCVGDVVIAKPPYDMGEVRIVIKRVHDIRYDIEGRPLAVFLVGDNSDHSYDSRDYGYVDMSLVISKVLRPREKRGDL